MDGRSNEEKVKREGEADAQIATTIFLRSLAPRVISVIAGSPAVDEVSIESNRNMENDLRICAVFVCVTLR
ncbi:unnamed protein product [Dibothriocephalus latus]|uniref:Uncharacterized protein n=1 Tax=Dibothriocephalus latus TaxID=60516 RepID=A0A3P7LLI9_DIBLA|nr:unnamed protein product [Dibothriocephalus latus]